MKDICLPFPYDLGIFNRWSQHRLVSTLARTTWHSIAPALCTVLTLFISAPDKSYATSLQLLDIPPAIVTLHSGQVTGVINQGVESFKGIRYAQAPVGSLRWRAPQPPLHWTGVHQASAYGHNCMQVPFAADAAPLESHYSEDCLFINIWRPEKRTHDKLPIMVWIHGGGFVNGGSSSAIYSGVEFAKRDVILISFNYRLGRFGYFAHPALTQEDADHGLFGNYGMMDQLIALRWIQRNAQAFGGNPRNVTLFGESAGGAAIINLLNSYSIAGLFHKAIIESGGGRNLMGQGFSLQQAEQMGAAFAASKQIHPVDRSALIALRNLPAEQVLSGLNLGSLDKTNFPGPIIDGHMIRAEPHQNYSSGFLYPIPLIIGANDKEFHSSNAVKSVNEAISVFSPEHREAALHAYSPDNQTPAPDIATMILNDRTMVEPARFIAQTYSNQGISVWQYRFAYIAEVLKNRWSGAQHASEIPYVFNTLSARYGKYATARDESVAKLMQAYWTNFAKSGTPNSAGLPPWNRYDQQKDNLLYISPAGAEHTIEITDPWKARLDLVQEM